MIELIKFVIKVSNKMFKVIRNLFLLLIFIIFAIASGWIKIVCDSGEIVRDVYNYKSSFEEKFRENFPYEMNNLEKRKNKMVKHGNRFYIKYTVKANESLLDLQQAYGVHWKVIKRINNIGGVQNIEAGKMILIPVLR